MNTHPDGRFRVGNITLSPYTPGMAIGERHARRLAAAMGSESIIRTWCEARGIEMAHFSNPTGHPHATYFKFRVRLHKDAAVAGWVPGLARAWAIRSHRGVKKRRRRVPRHKKKHIEWAHLHDWHQLLNFLERWYESLPSDQVVCP